MWPYEHQVHNGLYTQHRTAIIIRRDPFPLFLFYFSLSSFLWFSILSFVSFCFFLFFFVWTFFLLSCAWINEIRFPFGASRLGLLLYLRKRESVYNMCGLSIHPSIHSSIRPSIYPSIHPTVHSSITQLGWRFYRWKSSASQMEIQSLPDENQMGYRRGFCVHDGTQRRYWWALSNGC